MSSIIKPLIHLLIILNVIISIFFLYAWQTDDFSFLEMLPYYAPMRYSTAFYFLLSSLGLLFIVYNFDKMVLLIVAILTLANTLALLDQILIFKQSFISAYFIAQISPATPNTAFGFMLVGLSLLILSLHKRYFRIIANYTATLIVILASVSLIGYMSGISSIYDWKQLTHMALSTSVCFFNLGVTILLIVYLNRKKQFSSPYLLTIPAAFFTLSLAFSLWQALLIVERLRITHLVQAEAHNIASLIQDSLEQRIYGIQRMAKRWEANYGASEEKWYIDAKNFIETQPGYKALEYVDKSFHIRWVEPLLGNEKVQNMNIAFDETRRKILARAIEQNTITVSRPIQLVQGGLGIIIYAPIYRQQFDGFIVGVLDIHAFFEHVLKTKIAHGLTFAVTVNGETLFKTEHYQGKINKLWEKLSYIDLLNVNWIVRNQINEDNSLYRHSNLPFVVFTIGILSSLLLVITIHALQKSKLHAEEADLKRLLLEKEVLLREETEIALQERNHELQEFSYVASHDLQEPLRTISSYIDLLKADYYDKLDEGALRSMQRMQTAVLRMKQLLNDLLEYAQIATKEQVFAPVNLLEIFQEIKDNLALKINEKHAILHIPPILPIIWGSRSQIYQLFQNLITNALKFSKKDIAPIIFIDYKDLNKTYTEITIRDNGIGFEEKHSQYIFQPFRRLNTKDRYEGSGIGLAFCKKIVRQHGGEITAKSRLGEGAIFKVRLIKFNHKNLENRR